MEIGMERGLGACCCIPSVVLVAGCCGVPNIPPPNWVESLEKTKLLVFGLPLNGLFYVGLEIVELGLLADELLSIKRL